MIKNVSAVIIVKNGADTLKETLDSLDQFQEIVLYDNGSTDDTLDIASSYRNVSVHIGEFVGFGRTKQNAVNCATNEWVFSLDADESAAPSLVEEIRVWDELPTVVGEIRRDNYFMGALVDKGGWGADWLVRLFNRQHYNFNDCDVHESVAVGRAVKRIRISSPIHHNAVQDIGQFLVKVNRYSEIRRLTQTKTYPPSVILIKALWRFIQSYFLRGGFLCGWRGMVIAWSNANGVFFKYMKIYADKNRGA